MKALVEGNEDVGLGWQLAAVPRLSARARNFEWLRDLKLERGCIDCGYRAHAIALDFDHRPDEIKLFQLAAAGGRTTASIRAEAAKCDVRCANCHRVVTAARRTDEGIPLSQGVVRMVRSERQTPAVYKARERRKAGRPVTPARAARTLTVDSLVAAYGAAVSGA
jgi:hypothetical protein